MDSEAASPKKDRNLQARHWCFTLWDSTLLPDEVHARFGEDLRYLIFQLEEGEKQKNAHYQGYVAFTKKKRLTQLRKLFDKKPHWEICKGTPLQNKAYCTKEEGRLGGPYEFGDIPPPPGARTDLDDLHDKLKRGVLTTASYSNEHFDYWLKYPKLIENYKAAQIVPREDGCEIHVTLLVGISECGKSSLARKLGRQLELGPVYSHTTGKWWDRYSGERVIILEDFKGSSMSVTDYKHLLDRYALRVQCKGSVVPMAGTHFFITSNGDPLDWWRGEIYVREELAITRRIHEVYYFEKPFEYYYFDSYQKYASTILTKLRDGEVRPPLPEAQTFVLD